MALVPLWMAFALGAPTTAPVTVEVVAVGHVDAPATKFVLSIDLSAKGDNEDKAKAALAKKKATLLQQLSAAGVTVVPEDAGGRPVSVDLKTLDIATDVAADDAKGGSKEPEEKPVASESFSVQGTTRAAITTAEQIIAKTDGASANKPAVSSISDSAGAARIAKRDAIAKAKLDAQNYADTLGYAGATVISVSERGDIGTLFTFGMAMAAGRPKNMFEPSHGDTVPVDVAVTVTFRLDGRK